MRFTDEYVVPGGAVNRTQKPMGAENRFEARGFMADHLAMRFPLALFSFALALAAFGSSFSAFTEEEDEPRLLLALCTDDDAEAFGALADEIRASSRFVELVPSSRCREEAPAALMERADAPRFYGHFEASSDGWTVLAIFASGANEEKRASRIPWLASPVKPLTSTIGIEKTHALALLIDGLILDFRYLALIAKPAPLPVETPICPEAPPPSPPPPPPAAPPPKKEIDWGLELGAGLVYLSPDAVAPRVELGGSLGRGRWRAVLDVGAELDSSYGVGSRTFTTFSSSVRVGARYLFVSGERGRLGVDFAAAWLENRYRRDLAGATTRTWSDFGVFIGLFGRARLAGPLGLFLRVGAAIFPTARVTSISDGPEKQVNLLTVPAVAGLDFDF